jgi:pilus assembly protein Flp/PilA
VRPAAAPDALSQKETIMQAIKKFINDEAGVTAIEYGLIAALIGVAIIVGAGLLGTNLNGLFDKIAVKVGAFTV